MAENDTSLLINMINIYKSFGEVIALDDINFEVGYGEVVGIVGDNGAGKSTLIKVMNGVHKPDKGKLYFKGNRVEHWSVEKARELGIETVFQERALGELQSLWKNIFMGRELVRHFGFLNVKKAKEEASRLLKDYIGFTSAAINPDSIIKTMSGGEKQGVAIARALYFQAELIILDEPTIGLSLSETNKVLDFIRGIKAQGKSAVMISHNIYHIFPVADKLVLLDRGKIVGKFKKEDISLDELVEKLYLVASTGHLS